MDADEDWPLPDYYSIGDACPKGCGGLLGPLSFSLFAGVGQNSILECPLFEISRIGTASQYHHATVPPGNLQVSSAVSHLIGRAQPTVTLTDSSRVVIIWVKTCL
eukprot:g31239.t1